LRAGTGTPAAVMGGILEGRFWCFYLVFVLRYERVAYKGQGRPGQRQRLWDTQKDKEGDYARNRSTEEKWLRVFGGRGRTGPGLLDRGQGVKEKRRWERWQNNGHTGRHWGQCPSNRLRNGISNGGEGSRFKTLNTGKRKRS